LVALIAACLFNVLWWVGAGLLWGQMYAQTSEGDEFEGAFNAATYYGVAMLFILVIPLTFSVLVKGGWANNTKVSSFFIALTYLAIGWGMTIQSGSLRAPGSGPLSWVSFDIANLNAIRLSWEETKRSCDVDNQACIDNAAKYYEGFPASLPLKVMGLDGFPGVQAPGSTVDREDLEMVMTGLIVLFIGGYGLFQVASGKNQGFPFKGVLGAATWTPEYQSAVFTSLIALTLGFTATFVLWSSDAAADPTHPFYENVMGMAITAFLIVFVCFVGVATEEAMWLEIALFAAGFFGLGAPVRMWQMTALSETEAIAPFMNSFGYGSANAVAAQVEMDRYRVGGVLTVISTVIVMYTCCKVLGADTKTAAVDGSPITTSPFLKTLRWCMVVASFVGIWTGVGMLWSIVNDALEAIDATDSDRGNACHYYVFLILFSFFGFFINALDAIFTTTGTPADGVSGAVAAHIPFASFKPLFWVSFGLVSAFFVGFLSVGTHDRQVWFLDLSFIGANELRAYIGGPLSEFVAKRAYGVDVVTYEETLTAVILIFLSNSVCYIASMSFPFTVRDSVPSSGFSSLTFWMATISYFFGIIGVCVAMSLENMAQPPIHQGAGNATVGDVACVGKHFNMYLDTSSNCFEGGSYLSERFSVNMMNGMPNEEVDYLGARYFQLCTATGIAILLGFGNFMGTITGNGRAVKASLIISAYALLSLGWAMNWQGAEGAFRTGQVSDRLCGNDAEGSDDNTSSDCQGFKAAFVFFWLQAFFGIIGGGKIIGDSIFANNVVTDDPVDFKFCGCGCCKNSRPATENIEMESRAAITDDL
jgi:hypothetical protein